MGKRTALFELHEESNAKIVDFAGWDMPLHYGSQLQEHHQVRQDAGLFDVSHMTIIDCKGSEVSNYLHLILANNIDKLLPGKALYTCMLTEKGGIIDDLIVYKITDYHYRLVVNSATHDKDLDWLEDKAKPFDLMLQERLDLAMIAVQGPQACAKFLTLIPDDQKDSVTQLKLFSATTVNEWFIARTGYTGEDGFEIIVPSGSVADLWKQLVAAGAKPCGLGARDTLRLEAGLNLYGVDMDESVTPLESNLAWTVALEPKDRQFIGREKLEQQLQEGLKSKLVGLVLESQGVLRNHQKIKVDLLGEGEITSGSFSPSLSKGIALARVPVDTQDHCLVEVRGKWVPALVIKPPFIRNGQKTFMDRKERDNE